MKYIGFSLFTLLIIFSACKNPQELEVETIEAIPKGVLVVDMSGYGGSAPIGISEALVTGNKLSLTVKYSGGCKKHDFQLVGHKMISKSRPPQRSIKLYHNTNGDDCREIIEEILVFDISEFAYGDEEIMLRLDGYQEPISYIPLR